jgi:hypothetical protein
MLEVPSEGVAARAQGGVGGQLQGMMVVGVVALAILPVGPHALADAHLVVRDHGNVALVEG